MRLLAVADHESAVLGSQLEHGHLGAYDAVVSCGDLRPGYLDYVATCAKAPLYYVLGNHDTPEHGYTEDMGGTRLDLHVVRIGGLRVGGLDGSLAYREGIVGYSEASMARRCVLLAAKAALAGGLDVLVTHAPPRGYGDMEDRPHRGFECFNWLLNLLRPQVMLHGHVHLNYGMREREIMHPSGCLIVNAFEYFELGLA